MGGEIEPHSALNLLLLDGPLLLGCAALWASRSPTAAGPAPEPHVRRMASFCWIGALAFTLLFLRMGRFATWAVPLAVTALAFELGARGLTPGPAIPLPGQRVLGSRRVFGALAVLGLLSTVGTALVNWRMSGASDPSLSPELAALGAQLPAGAQVAANWDDAEAYAAFAPHARFLNLLDPVFMAVSHPGAYRVWRSVRDGQEPDVAGKLLRELHSDYLAFAAASGAALEARLRADPRFELLHSGSQRLYRLRPSAAAAFVGDWNPRSGAPLAGNDSGYVDATAHLAANGCTVLTHRRAVDAPSARFLELAAWGPSTLFVDGEQRLQLIAAQEARLGQGVLIPLRLAAGAHSIAIRTCVHQGHAGFYLLDRAPIEPGPSAAHSRAD